VIFPSAGSWRYAVDDDFSARHRFGPVDVAHGKAVLASGVSTGADEPGSGRPGPAMVGLLAAAVLLVIGGFAVARRRAHRAQG
jgi:hypothetical protein